MGGMHEVEKCIAINLAFCFLTCCRTFDEFTSEVLELLKRIALPSYKETKSNTIGTVREYDLYNVMQIPKQRDNHPWLKGAVPLHITIEFPYEEFICTC